MSGISSEDCQIEDGQSEDGELRQSPSTYSVAKPQEIDYQSGEDDGGDSLDIKPPQARLSDYRRKKKGLHKPRHRLPDVSDKKRDSRHGHKEKHRRDKSSRHQTKDNEHKDREKDRYYREKQQSYEQMVYTEQQYLNERAFRERKSEEARARQDRKFKEDNSKNGPSQNRESRGDKNRKERQNDDKRASKALADLRERLIEKRKIEEVRPHDIGSTEKREFKEVDENLEDPLEGEAGSYVREIITLTAEERNYRKDKELERILERHLTEEEKLEREQRREKLLEAEREMARLKERTKAEREKRHIERAMKRKQEAEEDANKRIKVHTSQKVVEVSDTSDPEPEHDEISEKSESEQETSATGRNRSRSYSRSLSKSSYTRSRSRSYSQEDSSNSAKSNLSRTHSRSRSQSRSCSRSRSRSNSKSSERSASRSRSKSRSPEEDEMLRNKDVKGENPQKIDNDLPPYYPAVQGCRSVEEFQCLNRIEEGTYGVVYRAKDKRTDEIVALKRLKMEKEKEGFPITSLREINTLLKGQHDNIVTVREIVVGSNMDKIFIVMDYVEHDLKSLMETMRHKKQNFMPGEVKCLLKQLLQAVAHLHDNWILHRDLKTSNLLLSHKGILKVGDFGLAREYGSPLKPYTPVVVTLWYRAPELLLCVKEYSTSIDVWSVGCIFAELLLMNALFPGKSEVDQLNRIFKDLGTPSEKIWKGFNNLPAVKKMKFNEYPVSNLRAKFNTLSETGLGLLLKFLTYDPNQRVVAEDALKHAYFTEPPLPIDPAMFPTWPAKSELGHKRALAASPKPPSGGGEYKKLGGEDDDSYGFRLGMGNIRRGEAGFTLKF